jgi:hypothetical protein
MRAIGRAFGFDLFLLGALLALEVCILKLVMTTHRYDKRQVLAVK